MTRNLKVLGIALMAVFAFSAVAASAASATEFFSNVKETHLTATAETDQVFKATPGDAKEVRCSSVNVSGTQVGVEVGGVFATNSVTVEPSYTGCGIYEENGEKFLANASIDQNGCKYVFHSATDANEHGEVSIKECNEGTPGITVTVSALNRPCIHVEKDQTVSGVHYETQKTEGGREDVTVEATVTGIKSETTNFSLVCPITEGSTHTNGTYNGNVSVTGYKDAAHTEAANIWFE